MRFRTRAFLLFFVPSALLLTLSFWTIQQLVESTMREGLRSSLRENQLAIGRVRSKSDLQNSRFLKVVGENAALKAGMQLLLDARSDEARQTVEDQLSDLCGRMGFDFLMVSGPDGKPLAGVIRRGDAIAAIDIAGQQPVRNGLIMIAGRPYQIASIPVDQADGNIGSLAIGEYFDFSEFNTPAVLIVDGRVVKSSIAGVAPGEIQRALAKCIASQECGVRLRGVNYLSTPMQTISFGPGSVLRSLQNVDSAVRPFQSMLRNLFFMAALGSVMVALFIGNAAAGSIAKPMGALIGHLRKAESTGILPEFRADASSIREIQDLTASFNRAAAAVREARQSLQRAYVEFIESLASALDARDPYTAGHSRRVSDFSCAIARSMGRSAADLERIRVGALLHDIGKIGVPDTVLRKAGRLTDAEFEMIRQHPEIGRRILEGVHGFAPYLPAVELHHENWDGTGYPHGQSAEQTHVDARIIHVADAYDAMTSDRPYRRAMTHAQAVQSLLLNAATQFDPMVVEAFVSIHRPDADPASRAAEAAEAGAERG